jgi:hypothetical protein
VSVPERETSPIPPSEKISAGMIPTFACPATARPGSFGPIIVAPCRGCTCNAQHFVRRIVLGDADHGADAGVDGLVDRVGREPRRDEDERRVRAPPRRTRATVLNTGMPSTSWPPLPGVTPATTFVP